MKICSKCKIEKLLAEFYVRKASTDGLTSTCKICVRNRNSKYYEANKEELLAKNRLYKREQYTERKIISDYMKSTVEAWESIQTHKTCKSCLEYKSLDNFYFRTDTNKHRNDCKICYNHYTGEQLNHRHEMAKLWRMRHPEYMRLHRLNNRDMYRNYKQKRRALETNALVGVIPNNVRDILMKNQKHLCLLCQNKITNNEERTPHVDHIQPLSKGGAHSMENLQITHASCNEQKWAHWPYEVV